MVRTFVVAAVVVGLLSVGADAQTARPRKSSAPKKPAVTAPAPAPAVEEPKPAPPPPPPADVRIVTAYTQGAQVSENTTYLREGRQRVEFPGMIALDQCDLQRSVLLSPKAKRYRIQPYGAAAPASTNKSPAAPDMAALAAASGMSAEDLAMMAPQGFPGFGGQPGVGAPPQKSGVVTVTTTLTDTLERQTLFGLEARRIRTVVTRQAKGDVCDKTPLRTEVDAWYIDLPKATSACGRSAAPAPAPPAAANGPCHDRTETAVVGDVTLGFPVRTTTTNVSGEGDKQETSTTSAEVTALEITRLDAALFDVPADYVEAKSALELAPAMASGSTLSDVLFGSTADGTSHAAPKRAGVTRIGVLEPINKSARTSLQMPALRQELVTQLTKPPYEALPLSGSSPEAIAADMVRLECDYVLLAEVKEVKTSKPGKMGGMMRMASGGGPAKDHHEVKLAYRLYPADGTATVKTSGEVKADNGGGFSIGSALRMAAFAGQLYMGFGGMGMMSGFGGMGGLGMGMGMMNPMFAMSRGGGMGAMGSSFFDPRSMAMSSMATGFGGMGGMGGSMGFSGMPGLDASDQEVFQVAGDAAGDVAKATSDALRPGKKTR